MRTKLFLLLTVLLFPICSIAYGASNVNESEQKLSKDSLALDTLNAANQAIELLVQERIQRYQDSLEQVTLQLQIDHTAEYAVRKELEAKLNQKRIEDSLRTEQIKQKIAEKRKDAVGYPTVIAGDTIRIFYTPLGALTPADRAEVTTNTIKEIANIFMPAFDSLVFSPQGTSIEIMLHDRVLSTVTQSDALWAEVDQTEMAREISDSLFNALVKQKEMTSIKTIVKQVVLSVLVIVVSVLLIRLIMRMYRRKIARYMIGKTGVWFKGWSIREYEFMNAGKQVRFVISLINILRIILSLIVVLIAFPMLFSIFPMTQRFAQTLWEWVFTPIKNIFMAIVDYLPDLFVVIIIIIVVRYLVKLLKFIMGEVQSGKLKITGFHPDWANSTYNILRVILYAFGLVMIFPYLPGSDSAAFTGVSVFLGVIISLGSSSMISNVIGGLVITYMRPFKIGDHIKIGDITGDVMEKTAFVTRIKTNKQEVITIPNSNVLAKDVVNYSITAEESKGVIYHTSLSFGYDIPRQDAERYLLEAADRCKFVSKHPAPFVVNLSLEDFYAVYQINVYTRHAGKQAAIYSELHAHIMDVCNENGVEIMSTHFTSIRDGNKVNIPEIYQKMAEEVNRQTQEVK